ncbi:MAG: N-acetyl-gamma-glutamyl-phosphate reductase [Saprospiraceae bacterium]
MIKIGIIGGAGYTAGELIRILIHHPHVEISLVQSNSQADLLVSDVHTDLEGDFFMTFSKNIPSQVDLLFLCSGHGQSREFLSKNKFPETTKIIDLSTDFRLQETAGEFIYGLPELNKNKIIKANKIANPGCFATAIQLALLPLAKNNLLKKEVHVNAITGSTGAGQKPVDTTHFSYRNNNVSIYKAFNHQHLSEINESITQLQNNFSRSINFIPVRGDFSRGIFASVYTACDLSEKELKSIYQDFYEEHPFVIIVDKNPSLKQVVNTNKCILFLEKHDDKILIVSLIDNLLKGASGQAVQNMNLLFGFPETTALQLKATVF